MNPRSRFQIKGRIYATRASILRINETATFETDVRLSRRVFAHVLGGVFPCYRATRHIHHTIPTVPDVTLNSKKCSVLTRPRYEWTR